MDSDLWNVKLDMIDKHITNALLHAEKKYRKLRIGEVDFLLESSEASERWFMQRLALKEQKEKETALEQ